MYSLTQSSKELIVNWILGSEVLPLNPALFSNSEGLLVVLSENDLRAMNLRFIESLDQEWIQKYFGSTDKSFGLLMKDLNEYLCELDRR